MMKPCEFCDTLTVRRSLVTIGGRVFPDTPVCSGCDTCDTCGTRIHRTLIENEHGTFVVHLCGCAAALDDPTTIDDGNTFIQPMRRPRT